MTVLNKAVDNIRHAFNKVAQSDTVRGAVLGASVAFSVTPGELATRMAAAATGAVIGGLIGAENLRSMFNTVAFGRSAPALQTAPVLVRPNKNPRTP